MGLKLYNTESRKIEEFISLEENFVKMYSCGMTVYYFAHIGHIRAYMTSDILRRYLEYKGYVVHHVMNVTDVGHMVSDQDEGEDKIEVGARKEGKSPWEIARYYENHFFDTISEVNIKKPIVIARATENIQAMIALIQKLEEKGYCYRTEVGVIFDTSKYPQYSNFAKLNLESQNAGARVKVDKDRKSPWDFALWVTNQPNHIMQWQSPWGKGFPGWHIECSAIISKYLGEQIDIHTGGIDHIPIHHTNEIAQMESATGKKLAGKWVHTEFLKINDQKMSKSLNNLYTIQDLKDHGFSPISLRYFYLGSHYRKQLDFTWDSLSNAQSSLVKLWIECSKLPYPEGEPLHIYLKEFEEAMDNDLNTSQALTVVWKIINSKEDKKRIAKTISIIDRVFMLEFSNAEQNLSNLALFKGIGIEEKVEAEKLLKIRNNYRKEKKFKEADEIRFEIERMGFQIEDSKVGSRLVVNANFIKE